MPPFSSSNLAVIRESRETARLIVRRVSSRVDPSSTMQSSQFSYSWARTEAIASRRYRGSVS